MQTLFHAFRDLHTNYNYPKPLACYSFSLPISFQRVHVPGTPSRALRVAVLGISVDPTELAQMPGLANVGHGDLVEAYEGQDPERNLEALEQAGQGANIPAHMRRALEALAFRDAATQELPPTDLVHLKLRKPDGSLLEVDFPWMAYADPECLATMAGTAGSEHFGSERPLPESYDRKFRKFRRRQQSASPSANPAFSFRQTLATAEAGIRYKILRNTGGDFGYLSLDDFDPKDAGAAFGIIRGLLENEFAGTKGLIIDLQDNGGGIIQYGEDLIQLFTPQSVEPESFQLRTSPEIVSFLRTSRRDPDFLSALLRAQAANQSYSVPIPIAANSRSSANSIGQFYFRPVAILTNSRCYSTCDIFTAGMQDNGGGRVWSRDGRTGGGGANVETNQYFYDSLPAGAKGPFAPLPGGQTMRIAWRRALRVKAHAGERIENQGVRADETIEQTPEDLFLGGQRTAEAITSDLLRRGRGNNAFVSLDIGSIPALQRGSASHFTARVIGTNGIEFRQGDRVLGITALPPDLSNGNPTAPSAGTADATVVPIPSAVIDQLSASQGRLEVIGYAGPNRVWRKVVPYRFGSVMAAPN